MAEYYYRWLGYNFLQVLMVVSSAIHAILFMMILQNPVTVYKAFSMYVEWKPLKEFRDGSL